MFNIKCVFVEKKKGFDVEAKSLLNDFKSNLRMENLEGVRVVNKYTLGEVSETYYKKALHTIFSELTVDKVYEEELPLQDGDIAFGVEYLPGQYDQRASSAAECFQLLTAEDRVDVKSSKIIILRGNLTKEDVAKIKSYYINPVDSREVEIDNRELQSPMNTPNDVQILDGFTVKDVKALVEFHKEQGLAMSIDDLVMIRDYFKSEGRDPSITEIKVIDTYWSDHCRHTTFSTSIQDVKIEENKFTTPIKKSYEA
ncbi:MAG TPA: phosphoribosylformylglycinamidine synthase, partial [Clostridium sp.]